MQKLDLLVFQIFCKQVSLLHINVVEKTPYVAFWLVLVPHPF